MIPAFPLYIFDVDGTLVDSAADICGAIQDVLGRTGCRPVTNEFLKGYIGLHLLDLFQDIFPGNTAAQNEALVVDYRAVYPARNHASTKPYPGVAEALGSLKGIKSTATTKGTPTTRIVLEMFGLLPYFDHVQGTDGFPAKPAPDVIFKSLELFGTPREQCLFIGDSPADMEAGRRAGVKTCGVLYGYGKREEMARWKPDYWVSDPLELIPCKSWA